MRHGPLPACASDSVGTSRSTAAGRSPCRLVASKSLASRTSAFQSHRSDARAAAGCGTHTSTEATSGCACSSSFVEAQCTSCVRSTAEKMPVPWEPYEPPRARARAGSSSYRTAGSGSAAAPTGCTSRSDVRGQTSECLRQHSGASVRVCSALKRESKKARNTPLLSKTLASATAAGSSARPSA